MEIDCQLSDKNMEKMLADGSVDADLGVSIPLARQALAVKDEDVSEDIKRAREVLADLKLT